MYTEKVMDHFMHPRNVGEIDNASGVGTVGNAKCGDIMRIFLDIDENQVVRDAKFKTFGCGAAIATSSMATEMIIGKTIQEALEVTNKAVMEALGGLPPGQGALLPAGRAGGAWPRCGIMRRRTTSPSRVSSRRSTTWTSWKKPTRTKLNLKIKKRIAFAVESNPFSYAVILPDWLHPALREWG